jgi:hypothetical protein
MAQAIECLPSKHKALNSNLSFTIVLCNTHTHTHTLPSSLQALGQVFFLQTQVSTPRLLINDTWAQTYPLWVSSLPLLCPPLPCQSQAPGKPVILPALCKAGHSTCDPCHRFRLCRPSHLSLHRPKVSSSLCPLQTQPGLDSCSVLRQDGCALLLSSLPL